MNSPPSEMKLDPKQIFLDALERDSPESLQRYLDEACDGNSEVRSRVEALLRVNGEVGNFLGGPPSQIPTTNPTIPEHPGAVIGPYKLLEQIGEGGMGVVYVAEQMEPVRRRVALKIIKPGMDTKQVIARFEAERQALAMMDHPHIAKVLDAGTTDAGRPYFVMELVRGLPVTEYCDKARLSPRQRLKLFIDVCHAVQHAHQKGVIHRDLKPSNVMITVHDGRPVAKVIDFGVAKAVGQQLTERTVYTAHTQLVGTPLYMSPEQADFSSQDVDTRSDVYSLGVLLYELLTGQTPFDKETLTKGGFDEMRRIIREDEPPCPSRRFSTLTAQAISTVSQQRSVDQRQLGRVLRGELDWIVMKALEKDRSRRYESASSLAADIQRYLSDEPVLACPPTAMYRFQKYARKHRPALVTAAAIAACLVLGTTVSAWQALRATTAEAQANANETQAQASAQEAKEKAQEASAQRDEAQQQRDDAQKQRDEVKALNEKLQHTLYTAHMNMARHAFEAGAMDQMAELLEEHRPKPGENDLRGFEWHYLYRLSHAKLLELKGHTQVVLDVAFSPDGKRLVSFGGGGPFPRDIKVWNLETRQELFTLKGHLFYALSPDGKRIASLSIGQPGEVKVWDAEAAKEILAFKGPNTDRRTMLGFSPDGKRLVSGSKIWDAQTGLELPSLQGGGGTFSPDGKRLVSASDDKTVKIWDAQTGQELLTLQGYTGGVKAFSSDSKLLASAADDNTMKILDVQTGQPLVTLQGLSGAVKRVTFSPDGKRLATAAGDSTVSRDKTVKVWDVQTGQELLTLNGHTYGAQSVAFSPDGTRLASGGAGDVKVWDALTGQELLTFKDVNFYATANSLVFSPDGTQLASASLDRMVKVWDVATAIQKPLTLKSGDRPIFVDSVAFSSDYKQLATAPRDKTVKLWDPQTGQELRTLQGHSGRVNRLAFSFDGKRLASASDDKTVKLWDAQTGSELFTLKGHTEGVYSVAFSSDGKRLASGATPLSLPLLPGGSANPISTGEVKLWDALTGEELFTLKGHSNCVAFSLDGTRLASAGGYSSLPGEVKVWNAQTGQELLLLKGHTASVQGVAFSPDGKRLASASNDKTVKVWDVQTGQELFTLRGHTSRVNSVAFSPDGKRLVSASNDKTVKVWDAQTGQELLTIPRGLSSIAFSPDGHRLAGNGPGGTVTIYDATPLAEKP